MDIQFVLDVYACAMYIVPYISKASWYDSTGKPHIKPSRELDIDNYPLEINLDDNDDKFEESESIQKNKKRTKCRIIRSVCFNKDVDSEKHHRELIMLFTSWRNETTEI